MYFILNQKHREKKTQKAIEKQNNVRSFANNKQYNYFHYELLRK